MVFGKSRGGSASAIATRNSGFAWRVCERDRDTRLGIRGGVSRVGIRGRGSRVGSRESPGNRTGHRFQIPGGSLTGDLFTHAYSSIFGLYPPSQRSRVDMTLLVALEESGGSPPPKAGT